MRWRAPVPLVWVVPSVLTPGTVPVGLAQEAAGAACWAGLDEADARFVCCSCGFAGCWQPPLFTPERCCPKPGSGGPGAEAVEGWPPSSVAAMRRNRTQAGALGAQELLCGADGRAVAARCTGRSAALADPVCRRVLSYAAGLGQACSDRLLQVPQCASGLLLALFAAELHAPLLWGVPRRPAPGYGTSECTLVLRRLQRALLIALDREPQEGLPGSDQWFRAGYGRVLRRCASIRDAELAALVPEARAAWRHADATAAEPQPRVPAARQAADLGMMSPGDGRAVGEPRLGVVMAVNWGRSAEFYGQTLELWECYCRRHGDCQLVLDTAESALAAYPEVPSRDEATGRTFLRKGREWNRWYALERHLGEFDLSFTADPDQFPSRQCFGTSFTAALAAHGLTPSARPCAQGPGEARCHARSPAGQGAAGASTTSQGAGDPAGAEDWPGPDVVMRDFPRYHSLNSAGVFLRNSPGARLLLRLLFDKVHWHGLPNLDQSAFDQTLLELLDLWHRSRGSAGSPGSAAPRSAACLEQLLAIPSWRAGTAERYAACWHDLVEALLGAFDERDAGRRARAGLALRAPVYLADPRVADFNYVLGNRSWADEPLVYHYAGKDKHLIGDGGETLLDWTLRSLWGGAALPPRRHPGPRAARNRTSRPPRRATRQLAAGQPRCAAWEQAAGGAGACEPGTRVEDCRGLTLAFC
mmetsp:Transcript_100307/g.323681  ORF Transcript_100307/g.323681 Transcript_100307/m.323681 type:complete len:701 (-) Transcript_100307:83-2185(-)